LVLAGEGVFKKHPPQIRCVFGVRPWWVKGATIRLLTNANMLWQEAAWQGNTNTLVGGGRPG